MLSTLTIIFILFLLRKKIYHFYKFLIKNDEIIQCTPPLSTSQTTVTSVDRTIEEDIKVKENLSKIEKEIESFSFRSIFEAAQYKDRKSGFLPLFNKDLPIKATTEEQIQALLTTDSLKGPYGLHLLNPLSLEILPTLPANLLNPNDNYIKIIKKIQKKIENIRSKINEDIDKANRLKEAYCQNQQFAIEEIAKLTLIKHAIPDLFQEEINIFYEIKNRIILIIIRIPDLSAITIVKQKNGNYLDDWIKVPAKLQKKLKEDLLYSLCIRAAYLVANSDTNNNFDLH